LFKSLYQQCFGPAVGINHLADLARLPFRRTVNDYQEAFLTKMVHAGYLSPEQVHLFTGGLPDTIRIDVELQAPQDLQRAMVLTRAYEQRSSALANSGRPPRPPTRFQQHAGSYSAPASAPAPTSATPAEMMERRRQKLFYLEVVDNEEDVFPDIQQDQEGSLISLQAVSGVRTADTLQVHVQVGAQEFTSLIYSGWTHNFFSHKAAQAANIQFQADTGARVVVANGDSVPCGGIARDIDIKIGQEIFNINAYSEFFHITGLGAGR
jgi:hypothetical protein